MQEQCATQHYAPHASGRHHDSSTVGAYSTAHYPAADLYVAHLAHSTSYGTAYPTTPGHDGSAVLQHGVYANQPGHPSPLGLQQPSACNSNSVPSQAYVNYQQPSLYHQPLNPAASTHRSSSSHEQPPSMSASSGVGRFPCPRCDKSFTRNFDRKRHMKTHVPGRSGNNRCQYCRKDYSRADALKRHAGRGCKSLVSQFIMFRGN